MRLIGGLLVAIALAACSAAGAPTPPTIAAPATPTLSPSPSPHGTMVFDVRYDCCMSFTAQLSIPTTTRYTVAITKPGDATAIASQSYVSIPGGRTIAKQDLPPLASGEFARVALSRYRLQHLTFHVAVLIGDQVAADGDFTLQ